MSLFEIIFIGAVALAVEKPAQSVDFSMLPRSEKIYTKETIIEVRGIKYRKVEFQGETYFMELFQTQSTGQDMKILCNSAVKESDALVRVGVQMTERTSLFVEGLKVACTSGGFRADSDARIALVDALAVGFRFKDSKTGPLSYFKNRRILVLPFFGFAADAP